MWPQTVLADTVLMTNRNHSFTSHLSFQTSSLHLNPGHCTGMSVSWTVWRHVNSFTISGFYFSLKWEADLTHVFSDEWIHVQTPYLAPFLFLLWFFISSSHLQSMLTERQQKTKGSGSWDHTCCNSGQCVDISTHVHYYISSHVAKRKKLQFLYLPLEADSKVSRPQIPTVNLQHKYACLQTSIKKTDLCRTFPPS